MTHPYAQFNFLIHLGSGSTECVDGGFQECSTIESDKQRGTKSITLKRGVIDRLSLSQLLDETGEPKKPASRTIIIRLQNEDRSLGQIWRLQNARIIKHTSEPLNTKGTDVVTEEMTLGYERLEIESHEGELE